ncbi:hypothetical protein CLOM_g4187 [Closterium sp. NIES-68]|nr:hypothetical protein CLOM_g4187 [Closterium sp. NIES-68]
MYADWNWCSTVLMHFWLTILELVLTDNCSLEFSVQSILRYWNAALTLLVHSDHPIPTRAAEKFASGEFENLSFLELSFNSRKQAISQRSPHLPSCSPRQHLSSRLPTPPLLF